MKPIVLTAILLLGIFSLMLAQPCGDRPNQGPNKEMKQAPQKDQKCEQKDNQKCEQDMDCSDPDGLGALNLTDDQKSKIELTRSNHRKEVIMIQAEIETLQIDMRTALRDKKFTDALKISDQIADKQKTIGQKRIQLLQSIYSLLTPEQQQKWNIKDGPMMGPNCPDRNGDRNCNHRGWFDKGKEK